jgi:hypothetical protein
MDLLAGRVQGFPKQRPLPVENRTGLEGRFDITLEFGLQNVGSDPVFGSRLEEAIQDCLGLKLEVVRAPGSRRFPPGVWTEGRPTFPVRLLLRKTGYKDPAGLPPMTPGNPSGLGWREVVINGDTRFDAELVRQ